MISIFIADDHPVIVEALSRLINEQADMKVAGSTNRGAEVVRHCANATWDVLVLDHGLPDMIGIEVVRRLRSLRPTLPVVIFSMQPEEQYAHRLIKTGANAFVPKSNPTVDLLTAIRTVHQGKTYVSAQQRIALLDTPQVDPNHPHLNLSDREFQIFLRLSQGRSGKEICYELNLGKSTVSTYVARIKRKLQANSVAELTSYAIREAIL